MIDNRSVPVNAILPHVFYPNVAEASDWLTRAFGFVEHYRYGQENGVWSGAQLHLGQAWIMLKSNRPATAVPRSLGSGAQSLTVFVEDVEEHHRRAKSAGAAILEEPHETVYGEFQYAAEDCAGHHWLFSRHARDVTPEEWGAVVREAPASRLAALSRPRLCYLEIPALDPHRSADFYQAIFGWSIRHRDTPRPSFDDATGNVSGAWVTGREIARMPGLLPYIWVDDIHSVLAKALSHGGQLLEAVHPDDPGSPSRIATFQDVAGNLIGLYEENVPLQPDHPVNQPLGPNQVAS